ncbi:MAG: hypothetical protein GY842_24365 [bacterium]|nr:hypothetical protein [bacterium]
MRSRSAGRLSIPLPPPRISLLVQTEETHLSAIEADRRLAGLAAKLGWRYSRYADDLTFGLPVEHQDAPRTGLLIGGAGRIVRDEGFKLHPRKTRISQSGSRQRVTGLVVNGPGAPGGT